MAFRAAFPAVGTRTSGTRTAAPHREEGHTARPRAGAPLFPAFGARRHGTAEYCEIGMNAMSHDAFRVAGAVRAPERRGPRRDGEPDESEMSDDAAASRRRPGSEPRPGRRR